MKRINVKRLAPHVEGGRVIDLKDWEQLVAVVKELVENQNEMIAQKSPKPEKPCPTPQ